MTDEIETEEGALEEMEVVETPVETPDFEDGALDEESVAE